jgi:hypothetical protein
MAEITKKDIFDTLSEFYGKMIEPRFDESKRDWMRMIKNFET